MPQDQGIHTQTFSLGMLELAFVLASHTRKSYLSPIKVLVLLPKNTFIQTNKATN